MAQWVKNRPAVQVTQEAQVRSLGWEDPLEKEMAAYSSILAWKIPWTEESLVECSPWGREESGTNERLSTQQPDTKSTLNRIKAWEKAVQTLKRQTQLRGAG